VFFFFFFVVVVVVVVVVAVVAAVVRCNLPPATRAADVQQVPRPSLSLGFCPLAPAYDSDDSNNNRTVVPTGTARLRARERVKYVETVESEMSLSLPLSRHL
jgi:hypothetical protein